MSDEPQNEAPALDKDTAKPKAPTRDPHISERDELLARMDAQIEQRRAQENEEFLNSSDVDPRAWMLHQQMQAEAKGQPLESATPPPTDEEPTDLDDGTASVEPVAAKPVAEKREAQRISNKGDDPLGDYVVRVNGKPMFKTLVNGQEKLIPLEAARTQLQKELAANDRFQQAAELRKQLDAREAQIRKTEAELAARSRQPAQQAAPVDDSFIDAEAVDLVRSLVTEPEAQAAARLAKTLKVIRQAQAPQIDVDAITKQAALVAKQTLAEDRAHEALKGGYQTFLKDYPDVAGDPELFALADRKTDAIAAEHPDWSPGEVMLEAGRVTREWMRGLGVTPKTPAPNGGAPSNRQQRKEGLRPMPTPRGGKPTSVQTESSDRQAPSEVVAEMRKARGQAY